VVRNGGRAGWRRDASALPADLHGVQIGLVPAQLPTFDSLTTARSTHHRPAQAASIYSVFVISSGAGVPGTTRAVFCESTDIGPAAYKQVVSAYALVASGSSAPAFAGIAPHSHRAARVSEWG